MVSNISMQQYLVQVQGKSAPIVLESTIAKVLGDAKLFVFGEFL
jgi:hypothetical protein